MNKRKVLILSLLLIGVLSSVFCLASCTETDDRPHFTQETTFTLTAAEVMSNDVIGYLSADNTTIVFFPDGRMRLTLTPNPALPGIVSVYMMRHKDDLAGISLSDMDRYTGEVLPGQSFYRLMPALMKLGDSLGLHVNGIDYEGEAAVAFFADLEESHTLPTFAVPKDLTVTIEASYALCEVPSATQEEPFRAIYLGDYADLGGDPILLLTRYTDDEGNEALFLTNETLALRFDFSVR
ncbi:MAG: hypothetical protein IJ735_01260 [Clostridia bacterium]|nr:hypothetical protein [Clostridia bacterium]